MLSLPFDIQVPYTFISEIHQPNGTDLILSFNRENISGEEVSEMRLFCTPDVDLPEEAEEGVSTASVWRGVLAKRCGIADEADTVVVKLPTIHCIHPRGSYAADVSKNSIRFHNNNSSFPIPYKNIKKIAHIVDEERSTEYYLIFVAPSVRKGSKLFDTIVVRQGYSDRRVQLAINYDPVNNDTAKTDAIEKLVKKYPIKTKSSKTKSSDQEGGDDQEDQSQSDGEGEVDISVIYERNATLLASFLEIFSSRTIDTSASSKENKGFACHIDKKPGKIYFLDSFFVFLPNPVSSMSYSKIGAIEFLSIAERTSSGRGGRKTFDMRLFRKNGDSILFSNLNSSDFNQLYDLFNQKKVKIRALRKSKAGVHSSVDYGISSGDDEEEDDDYEIQSEEDEDGSDSESESGSGSDSGSDSGSEHSSVRQKRSRSPSDSDDDE